MEHKEFTMVEIGIGLVMLTLPVDLLCFLIDWTGVGLFLSPLIQGAAMFGTWLWLRSKGDAASLKFGRQILRYVSNVLPFLPTVTIVFLIETYLHNHPETSIAKVAQVGSAVKAGAGATGGTTARLKAARTAYRETPVDARMMADMERERTGGAGTRAKPIKTTGNLTGTSRDLNLPEPIE